MYVWPVPSSTLSLAVFCITCVHKQKLGIRTDWLRRCSSYVHPGKLWRVLTSVYFLLCDFKECHNWGVTSCFIAVYRNSCEIKNAVNLLWCDVVCCKGLRLYWQQFVGEMSSNWTTRMFSVFACMFKGAGLIVYDGSESVSRMGYGDRIAGLISDMSHFLSLSKFLHPF